MAEIPRQAPSLSFRDSPHRTGLPGIAVQSRRITLAILLQCGDVEERVRGLTTGTGVKRGGEQEREGKQLRCPGQSRMDHNPLERGDRGRAGGGKGAFLRLTESHGMGPSHRIATPTPNN